MILEFITKQIREEISKLNQVLHLLEGGAKKATRAKARRKISAAGRKRIAAARGGKVGEDPGSKEIEKSPDLVRVPTPTSWKWAFFPPCPPCTSFFAF
jgi:hypothetical protein